MLETTSIPRRPEPPRPTGEVADFYAAAAARIVVTSKRSFVTSCGVRQFTGEVMAVDCVQLAEVDALEAAFMAVIARESLSYETDPHTAGGAASTLFDPDVLLAWLLTEGVSAFH